jgi:hypothetical protein
VVPRVVVVVVVVVGRGVRGQVARRLGASVVRVCRLYLPVLLASAPSRECKVWRYVVRLRRTSSSPGGERCAAAVCSLASLVAGGQKWVMIVVVRWSKRWEIRREMLGLNWIHK